MKILLILLPIVVGLAAAVATLVVGGAFLPKAHTATRSVKLAATPEAVWAAITDFASHPTWRPGLKSIEKQADRNGHAMWLERGSNGPMLMEVTAFEPPRRMVTRIADDNLPFGGSWTYEVTPEPAGGCRVRITEDGEIYNLAFRYMAQIFGLAATMEKYLGALGTKLGERVTVEP